MTEEKKNSELVQLGALWKNEGKDGGMYLSGNMGSATLFVFKNKWKKGDRDPDYRVYVGANRKKKKEAEATTTETTEEKEDVGF